MEVESIRDALFAVMSRVEQAAKRSGRRKEEIRLIAVSKMKSAEFVREAYEAGQRDFGENYVQEMVEKAKALEDLSEIRWHMIGHVQTNKVKMMMGCVGEVQTIDSQKIALELDRRAREIGRRLDVMIEVNVGDEEQKSGVGIGEAIELVQGVENLRGLKLRGLMTVPPFDLDPTETRVHFRRLAKLRNELGGEARIAELSMGMSHDFMEAIDEGATSVRVGSAIFGNRERAR